MTNGIAGHRFAANGLTLGAAAALIALGGILAGSGDIALVTVVIGAFIGVLLLYNPVVSLWLVIAGGLVVAGVTQLYFPPLQFVRWPIALLSAALGAIAMLQYAFSVTLARDKRLSPIFFWVMAFLCAALFSGMLNYQGAPLLVYGIKGYFQVWGLFIALVLFTWPARVIDQIPKLLIGLGFLQIPFVLHQHVFLVPGRVNLGHGIVPEDVVVGTLGASATGGGANAVLSILVLTAAAILTALFKRGAVAPWRFAAGVLLLLFPILLNANKIAVLYVLLIYLLMFATDIFRKPGKVILSAGLFAAVVMAIFWSYTALLSTSERATSWRDLIAHTVEANTGAEQGYGSYELNRATTIPHWYDAHRDGDLRHIVFGHGVGASREGEGGVVAAWTLAQRSYSGVGIGLITVSAVLWEVGVAGLLLLTGIFWSTWAAAGRLAAVYRDDIWRSSTLLAFRAVIVIFAISLFHKNSFVFHLPYQTLLMIVLGYVAYWDSVSRQPRSRQPAAPTALAGRNA